MAVGGSRVGSGEVVVMYPQYKPARASARVALDEGIGTPAQQGLDEMLILVIGVRRVWARADLPDAQAAQQRGKAP